MLFPNNSSALTALCLAILFLPVNWFVILVSVFCAAFERWYFTALIQIGFGVLPVFLVCYSISTWKFLKKQGLGWYPYLPVYYSLFHIIFFLVVFVCWIIHDTLICL